MTNTVRETTKIAVLQREHDELVKENMVRKEEINKLKVELDSLRIWRVCSRARR